MKIEFTNMNLGIGSNMVIGAKEFLKARDNEEEMRLLVMATECFTAPNCFEYYITQEEYDYVASWIKSSGKVIFAIEENAMHNHRWLEVYVIVHDTIKKVRYSNNDGEDVYIISKKERTAIY